MSLPSQWLLRKNAEFERLKQRISRAAAPGSTDGQRASEGTAQCA